MHLQMGHPELPQEASPGNDPVLTALRSVRMAYAASQVPQRVLHSCTCAAREWYLNMGNIGCGDVLATMGTLWDQLMHRCV